MKFIESTVLFSPPLVFPHVSLHWLELCCSQVFLLSFCSWAWGFCREDTSTRSTCVVFVRKSSLILKLRTEIRRGIQWTWDSRHKHLPVQGLQYKSRDEVFIKEWRWWFRDDWVGGGIDHACFFLKMNSITDFCRNAISWKSDVSTQHFLSNSNFNIKAIDT